MSETLDRKRKAQYESYLKAELGAAAQYQAMSQVEKDPKRAEVFRRQRALISFLRAEPSSAHVVGTGRHRPGRRGQHEIQ